MENNNNKNNNQGGGNHKGGRGRHHHRPHHRPAKNQNAENQPRTEQVTKPEAAAPQSAPKPQPVRNEQKPARNERGDGKNGGRRDRDRRADKPAAPQNAPAPKKEPTPKLDLGNDDWLYDSISFEKKKPEKTYTFTEEELDAILAERPAVAEDDRPRTEVVGIRFKKVGKMYYFAPGGIVARVGDGVIVETARGMEFGQVCLANTRVLNESVVQPLRPVIRLATPEDVRHNEENAVKEADAFRICIEKIAAHGLDMKLVDAQFTFDNTKLVFYFTSAGRVDFRDLVKDLASVFHTRIELRQIGIRDEAKLMGGLGACGRPLCCASHLSDFVQVSIKMAKEQNLSLNSNKISGVCGRLMCCLNYEYSTYQEEIAKTPPVDSVVDTPEGRGTVIEINPLAATVKVKITVKQETVIKSFSRDSCTVVDKKEHSDENNQ